MATHQKSNPSQAKETTHKRQTVRPVQQEAVLGSMQQSDLAVLQRAVADPGRAAPGDILALQRAYGNRAVTRLIQTKLTVGPVGDRYEREADRVAERVMSMTAPVRERGRGGEAQPALRRQVEEEELQMQPLAASITPIIQRQLDDEDEIQMQPLVQRQLDEEDEIQMKPLVQPFGELRVQRQAEEEEELQMQPLLQRQVEEEEELQMEPLAQRQAEEEEELQMKPLAGGGFEANPDLERRLTAHKGSGSPLPDETRAFMEPRFGADFSGVQVHTGGEAVQLTREINAQAFTHGQDIYLGAGKYDPGSGAGKRLLAHELTHTIQQTGGQVKGDSQNQVQPALTNTISRSPSAVVQREIMSHSDWLKVTTLSWKKLFQTKTRPVELKGIDDALGEYHRVADPINLSDLEDAEKVTQANNILGKVQALKDKIGIWEKERGKLRKSKARKPKVENLKNEANNEMSQIIDIKSAAQRVLKQAEQATVRNQILPENKWETIKNSDDPKQHAFDIFHAFMNYGRRNFTYNFKGRGDLLAGETVGACGSFALALSNLFKYVGIQVTGMKEIPEKEFITVPLDDMYYIDENPEAANVKDRGGDEFNRFKFGSHWVLDSEAGTYDPTTGAGPNESTVAVAGFQEAEENEKELFDQKKDKHRLKAVVQDRPKKYEYWQEM